MRRHHRPSPNQLLPDPLRDLIRCHPLSHLPQYPMHKVLESDTARATLLLLPLELPLLLDFVQPKPW